MARINEVEQLWHNDGHRVILRINRAELEVLEVICPHGTESAPCKTSKNVCIVSEFIYTYGMECNGGMCPAAADIPICWTVVGDMEEFDSAQVWFMPLTDEIFSAWLISNGLDPEPPRKP